ncbi:MAG: GDCCVxC domain-containing (seleno)protein [bacterium]|nr:GDCCVxC domain-containing (seleno)protein [bacterium]
MSAIEFQSDIICPFCGHKKTEVMPSNACVFFYECALCKKIIRPKQGDCCVFCSYGTVKCPPVQSGNECC